MILESGFNGRDTAWSTISSDTGSTAYIAFAYNFTESLQISVTLYIILSEMYLHRQQYMFFDANIAHKLQSKWAFHTPFTVTSTP